MKDCLNLNCFSSMASQEWQKKGMYSTQFVLQRGDFPNLSNSWLSYAHGEVNFSDWTADTESYIMKDSGETVHWLMSTGQSRNTGFKFQPELTHQTLRWRISYSQIFFSPLVLQISFPSLPTAERPQRRRGEILKWTAAPLKLAGRKGLQERQRAAQLYQ